MCIRVGRAWHFLKVVLGEWKWGGGVGGAGRNTSGRPCGCEAFRIYERLKNIPKCRKYDGFVCFARSAINITGRRASNAPPCSRDPYLDSDFGILCFRGCGYGPSRARLIARTHRITNWIWPRMWVPVPVHPTPRWRYYDGIAALLGVGGQRARHG